ncbi:MAG: hypothetical protein KC731_21060 [Myxococcales bacterium]|nr:hypothetical protein [Myxococcales bacterium]
MAEHDQDEQDAGNEDYRKKVSAMGDRELVRELRRHVVRDCASHVERTLKEAPESQPEVAAILIWGLEKRFGSLSASEEATVRAASLTQLCQWLEPLLEAKSVAEVLGA